MLIFVTYKKAKRLLKFQQTYVIILKITVWTVCESSHSSNISITV